MANVESFDAFYLATRRSLFAYVYSLTGDRVESQDLTQEAYTRAWRSWRTVEVHPNPEAWLRTVVWRLAARRWRRRKLAAMVPSFLDRGEEEAGDRLLDRAVLVDALRRIPAVQRRVVAMRYLYDLPLADIAEELQVPVGTVKSRLSRGLAALGDAFGEDVVTADRASNDVGGRS